MEIQTLVTIILSSVIFLTCLLVMYLYWKSRDKRGKGNGQRNHGNGKDEMTLGHALMQNDYGQQKQPLRSQPSRQPVQQPQPRSEYQPPQPRSPPQEVIHKPSPRQATFHDGDWDTTPEGINLRLISVTSLPLARVILSCQAKAMQRGVLVGGEVKWPLAVTETTTLIWNTTRFLGCLREEADCVRLALVTQDRSVYGKAEIPMHALGINTVVNTRVACSDGSEVTVSIMCCSHPNVMKSVFLMKLPTDDELQDGMSQRTRRLAEELEKKIASIIQHPMNEVELEFCNIERVVLGPFVLAAQATRICLQPLLSVTGRNVAVSRYAKLNADSIPANAAVFNQYTQQRTEHLYSDNLHIADHLLEAIPIDTAELCTQNLLDCTDATSLKSLINQLVFAPDKIFILLLSHEYCEMLLANNLSDNIPDMRKEEILNAAPFSIMHFDMDFRLPRPIRNVSTLAAGVVPGVRPPLPRPQEPVDVPPKPLLARRQPSFVKVPAPVPSSDPTIFRTPVNGKADNIFETRPSSPPQHNLNSLVSHTPGVTSIRMMPLSENSHQHNLDARETELNRREIELGGREVALLLREKQQSEFANRTPSQRTVPYG